MGRRKVFPVGGVGGGNGDPAWTTLLDADFAGDAGDALADADTITRSGVVWTFRAESDTRQTWTPAAAGLDIAVTNATLARNTLTCAIDDALVLGRLPDNYDVFAVQALYAAVSAEVGVQVIGVAYGSGDATVAAGGMTRALYWMMGAGSFSAQVWLASLRNAAGANQLERTIATGVAAPNDQPVVVGAVITDIMGGQIFGAVNRSTLYDAPGDLRGLMMHRSAFSSERPQVDRIGAIATSTSLGLKATLSRIRIQHFRLPGAPDPA